MRERGERKMADMLSNIRATITNIFGGKEPEEIPEGGEKDYVELETVGSEARSKVFVRPFVMENFQDIKLVIDSLREGSTIALINIRPLKEKDMIELKRAINKLKKTTDAVNGDIAGFGDDYIIATPGFAQIFRAKAMRQAAVQQQGAQGVQQQTGPMTSAASEQEPRLEQTETY